jgi:cell division protein FtsB
LKKLIATGKDYKAQIAQQEEELKERDKSITAKQKNINTLRKKT